MIKFLECFDVVLIRPEIKKKKTRSQQQRLKPRGERGEQSLQGDQGLQENLEHQELLDQEDIGVNKGYKEIKGCRGTWSKRNTRGSVRGDPAPHIFIQPNPAQHTHVIQLPNPPLPGLRKVSISFLGWFSQHNVARIKKGPDL